MTAIAESALDANGQPEAWYDPAKPVQLVFADKADKKLATMHAVEVHPVKRLVMATSEANVAAGFAAHKTYVVRVMQGKTVLAKAELSLKD